MFSRIADDLAEHGWSQQDDFLPQDLALFLSAGMRHEVLPSSRDRLSLTGWFKRRAQV